MTELYVELIKVIIGPIVLFLLQILWEKRKQTDKKINEVLLRQTRSELLFALEHHPDDENTILTLYDKYRAVGGNSYVCAYVANWKRIRNATKKKKNDKAVL